MMRAFNFSCRPIEFDGDAFDMALTLKRALWDDLVTINEEYNARRAALKPAFLTEAETAAAASPKDKNAKTLLRLARSRAREEMKDPMLTLGTWRVDRQREAKQRAAANGLHFGDYNSVVFQFNGNVAAAKKGVPGRSAMRLGDALVNQITGGCPWVKLLASSKRGVGVSGLSRIGGRHQPGSRRGQRHEFTLTVTQRGPQNPLGPVRQCFQVLMHRKLPPAAMVKEVRMIRTWRHVINKDGVAKKRADWRAIFVCDVTENRHTHPDRAIGIDIGWPIIDGLVRYAVTCDDAGLEGHYLPVDHVTAWEKRQHRFDVARDSDDAADWTEARGLEARLQRRRRNDYRAFAARIARDYGVVAVADYAIPQGGGQMHHAAPHVLKLALAHAVEKAGGVLMEMNFSSENRARRLYEAAVRGDFQDAKDENDEDLQRVA